MSNEVLREEVERELGAACVHHWPRNLAALYEARLGPERRRRLSFTLMVLASGTAAALGFELLYGVDRLAMAMAARAGECSVIVLCAVLIRHLRPGWQEGAAYCVPVLGFVVVNACIGESAPAMYADRYFLATICMLAALCLVPPVPRLAGLLLGVGGLVGLTAVIAFVPGTLRLPGNYDIVFFGVLVLMVTRLACFRQETSRRRAFLLALHDELATCELIRMNAELVRMTNTDALTGLDNRRKFEADLGSAWSGRQLAGPSLGLGVLILDVDHFKQFNDSAGHAAGDACLRQVAAAIAGNLRGGDLRVARYGGEEFAVLAAGIAHADVAALGERLREAVEALTTPHPGRAGRHLTISVGVAWCEAESGFASEDDLLRAADQALYAAKIAGRNRVVLDGALARPVVLANTG